MKKILLLLLFIVISFNSFSQSFVSPIDFNPTEENINNVVQFIQHDVKVTYEVIGMDDPSTLRMMEKENLKAFKELIKISNTTLLRNVIETYCDIGMCNYTTILMMYKEQNKASKQKLKW